ncbi:MAG: hypothetical protein J1F07_08070 [Muribaculaceae bacterium]|nr:hypothetical protein [Muribaculaceae bacterium]
MKRLNYLILGAAALTLASCSQDETLTNGVDDGLYHISVKLPADVATRNLGDGLTADNLYMAVYDADNNNALIYDDLSLNFGGQISTEVALSLSKGKSYNIAFFALSPEAAEEDVYAFSSTDGQIKVNYEKMLNEPNNADAYDCFFKLYSIENYNGATAYEEVLLNRPVAQVNWGTNDLTADYPAIVDNFGANGEYIVTGFSTKAYNTYDFFAGTDGSGDVVKTGTDAMSTVELVDFTAPTGEAFPVEGYNYVALQYLLAPQTETLYNLVLNISNAGNPNVAAGTQPLDQDVDVANAPVQANYRTNIYGQLLSEDLMLTVTKDKEWGTPDYEVMYIDGNAYLVINSTNANKLWNANGYFILSDDIFYPSTRELMLQKTATIDLNGHSLTTQGNANGDAVVVQGATVTLSNGELLPSKTANSSNASATLMVQGSTTASNVTLDNMTITGYYPVRMTSSNTASTITINSGTYYPEEAEAPAVLVGAEETSTAGKVTIYGGTFGQAGVTNRYLLNVMDNVSKNSDEPRDFIEVFGGTYINFDPANCISEGNPTNFVADGYKSVASTVGTDTYYTVVPASTAIATTTDELSSAISSAKNGDTILIGAGELQLPASVTGKTLTFKGLSQETTTIDAKNAYWNYENCNVNFEDMTLVSFVNPTNHTSMGFQNAKNQTYTNVKFVGEFHVFTGNATFNNCDFEYEAASQTNYQLWCQTSGTVNINNCTMTCNDAKAILVYGWPGTGGAVLNDVGGNININGLTVTNNTSNSKAVVEIHSELYTKAGTININNVTYPETFQKGLWQEIYNENPYKGQKTDYYKIVVNGKVEQDGGFTGEFKGN